jgi:uncharacterized coiled-coil protein SlyX
MGRAPKFTDAELMEYLKLYEGDPHIKSKLAKLFKVSIGAITERMDRLERKAALQAQAVVNQVEANVWDIRQVFHSNRKLVNLIEGEMLTPDEKVRALGEARKYGEAALKCAEALYRVEQVQAFQEAVLQTLDEADPQLRERVMAKLKSSRVVRAGFM